MRRTRPTVVGLLVVALVAASCNPGGEQASPPEESPWAVPALPGVERVVPDEPGPEAANPARPGETRNPADPPNGPSTSSTFPPSLAPGGERPAAGPAPVSGPAPTSTTPNRSPAPSPGPTPAPTPGAGPLPIPTTTVPGQTTPITAPPTTAPPGSAPTTPPATGGGDLVYSTVSNGSATSPLHGAILAQDVDVRLQVAGSAPDRVEWRIDGVLFRNDDRNAPFNVRYAGRLLPIGDSLDSDQGLPGSWDFAPGTQHVVTAVVIRGTSRSEVTALFLVAGGSAPPPTTTAPPGTTTTSPPAPTTTAPPPPTTTLPPSGVVDAPRGVLGPLTSTPVDPESVGISWDGGKYKVPGGFRWDESADGGYLHFDRGRVLITGNGVSISGAVFDGIAAGNNSVVHAGAGVGAFTLRHFRLQGGSGSAGVGGSIGRGNASTISNFSIIGFDGDGMKPPIGSTITDGYIHLVYKPGSPLHYDGVQITGRSNITLARLRFRLDGDDNLNAAVFIHGGNNGEVSNNNVVTDIDIEHAPYCWFPMRINSGTVVLRDVIGRGPKSADGKRPAALVLHGNQAGIEWATIHSAFDGGVPAGRVG